MTTNLIDVDAFKARQSMVDEATRWFAFEGPVLGEQSPTPLAVKLFSGGKKWGAGWTKGMQSYVASLPAGQRRKFNEKDAKSYLTLPPDCLEMANRAAIRHSGAVLAVKLVGPVLSDPAADLPADVVRAYKFRFQRLPEDLAAMYRLKDDGTYAIPLQTEPHPLFRASAEQILVLMGLREFVNDIGTFHVQLTSEETENEEGDLANLDDGSDTAGPGTT